jgi:huntingtin
MASVNQTLEHINSTLKSSEGYYSNYSCKTVSWDDVQRGTIGGGSKLSCWGANITDTRLYAKDGRLLYTIRGDNWNERLGKVTSNDLTLVATTDGNKGDDELKPFTLRHVLENISKFGSYAGIQNITSFSDDTLDEQVSVRFQTTFLPVEQQDDTEHPTIEFAPEAYNYNTTSDDDPRNLILLCTTQGLALQQDGSGAKKLFHHAIEPATAGVNGKDVIHRYWLEAESSSHKVGGSQVETKEEKEDAIQRGKATSSVIGIKSMETRFNVLMTIQIPLKQKERERNVDANLYGSGIQFKKKSGFMFKCGAMATSMANEAEMDGLEGVIMEPLARPRGRRLMASPDPPTLGKSSAARVSRGSREDTWSGLSVTSPQRHPHEHITATIVMYYTCSGGVPTEDDVKSAIDDLESLYQSVETSGHLADSKFDFMKGELTVQDMNDIVDKVTTQPPMHSDKVAK